MATVNFLYRSIKDMAALTIRLQYWEGKKGFFVDAKTSKFISKVDFEIFQENKTKNSRDSQTRKIKKDLNDEMVKLEEPILLKLAAAQKDEINKEWLQNIVTDIYHPELATAPKIIIPTDLISFIDYFVIEKVLNSVMTAKYNVLKMRLQKFQDFRKSKITFSDFNLSFAYEFSKFYKENQNFMDNTLKRDFGYIASLCIYAKRKGVDVNDDWVDFKFSKVKKTDLFPKSVNSGSDKIFYQYFNFEEIKTIENLEGLSESLDNVRDWLLISLLVGQRISDWMRFDKSMIIKSRGKGFIKFTQAKTGNEMMIPVYEKLQKILDKRNGDFPRQIEFQKYNDYVKKVAEKAGFTEKVMGYKDQVLEGLGKRRIYGEYERWELISSHIGRRSFATNFYKQIPTYDIMFMTGHKTEGEFLRYINETSEDRAHDIADKYFQFFK